MKIKILPILFILILAAPFYGMFLYFHFEKKQIKHEIKKQLIAGISKNELVKFSVSSEELQKVFNKSDRIDRILNDIISCGDK